jgi:mono/diheme cytochrome c family protein
MKRDFNFWVLGLAFGMPLLFLAFIAGLYFIPCGFKNNCDLAALPEIIHTPIPTIIPATMPAQDRGAGETAGGDKCPVQTKTLLAAWVNAMYPENDAFQFTDLNGSTCEATYTDLQVLFHEGNLWYTGAPACITCHNSNLAAAAAQMDLSSYAGILAGSRRASAGVKGNDILGAGVWEQSKLNDMLFVQKKMPLGRPADAFPDTGPTILFGHQVANPAATPTMAAGGGGDVARPSNPGEPGEAIHLTGDATAGAAIFETSCAACHGEEGVGGIPNPGSDDGTIPPLKPIDSTLISPDLLTYATNLDLFIQNGSTPAGPAPVKIMPAWGKDGKLTQQQIADVIAYLISLNK